MPWDDISLKHVAESDDLHVSPFRNDGVTYGTPTWIWSVVVDGKLYVRAYNGKKSRWYQAAVQQRAGRVTTVGMTLDVSFHPVDGEINGRIDDAYSTKYAKSNYLAPMIGERARAATILITPRD